MFTSRGLLYGFLSMDVNWNAHHRPFIHFVKWSTGREPFTWHQSGPQQFYALTLFDLIFAYELRIQFRQLS